jgi:hypothetical protein
MGDFRKENMTIRRLLLATLWGVAVLIRLRRLGRTLPVESFAGAFSTALETM